MKYQQRAQKRERWGKVYRSPPSPNGVPVAEGGCRAFLSPWFRVKKETLGSDTPPRMKGPEWKERLCDLAGAQRGRGGGKVERGGYCREGFCSGNSKVFGGSEQTGGEGKKTMIP